MFSKTTLSTAVALAIFASAAPVEVDTGISIPLHKRGSLTRYDGVFDHSKAIRATVKAKNKYRQNMINLVQNGGNLHADARILSVAEVQPMAVSKRQKESLTDEENDTEWAGTVTIGSNGQQFLIDFDSELSSLLPLPSASLRSSLASNS
jgi:cathepsin D